MPKITQGLSYTLHNKELGQYCKVNFEISEIDTEVPLEEQMEKVMNTVDILWKFVKEKVNKDVIEVWE